MKDPDKKRVLCPIRLNAHKYELVKLKAIRDGLSYQKVVEILLLGYLSGDKYICALINKFVEEKNEVKKSNKVELSTLEANNILDLIESQYSPLRDVLKAQEELDDENK